MGHWIVAGQDPIQAVRNYGKRNTYVDVKDVSGEVLERMLRREIPTMNSAVEGFKLFVPPETGLFRARELSAESRKVSFTG